MTFDSESVNSPFELKGKFRPSSAFKFNVQCSVLRTCTGSAQVLPRSYNAIYAGTRESELHWTGGLCQKRHIPQSNDARRGDGVLLTVTRL
jgi:hypothetical protein